MSQIGHFSLKEQAFALLKRIEHDASVNVIDTEHLPPRLYRRRIEQLPIDEQENEQNEGNLQAASENDDNALRVPRELHILLCEVYNGAQKITEVGNE